MERTSLEENEEKKSPFRARDSRDCRAVRDQHNGVGGCLIPKLLPNMDISIFGYPYQRYSCRATSDYIMYRSWIVSQNILQTVDVVDTTSHGSTLFNTHRSTRTHLH